MQKLLSTGNIFPLIPLDNENISGQTQNPISLIKVVLWPPRFLCEFLLHQDNPILKDSAALKKCDYNICFLQVLKWPNPIQALRALASCSLLMLLFPPVLAVKPHQPHMFDHQWIFMFHTLETLCHLRYGDLPICLASLKNCSFNRDSTISSQISVFLLLQEKMGSNSLQSFISLRFSSLSPLAHLYPSLSTLQAHFNHFLATHSSPPHILCLSLSLFFFLSPFISLPSHAPLNPCQPFPMH